MEESPAAPPTVFVVDDDRGLLRLMEKALRREGIATSSAGSGKDAISWLAGNRADLMLLDLKLPKVNGFEVLEQVRADENLKMIPVVVLTSSHEERDLVKSYKLGVNAYVVKPVDFHQFVNAVKELGVFWAVINEPPPGSVKKT